MKNIINNLSSVIMKHPLFLDEIQCTLLLNSKNEILLNKKKFPGWAKKKNFFSETPITKFFGKNASFGSNINLHKFHLGFIL